MSKNINSLLQWHQDNGCDYLFSERPHDLLADSLDTKPIETSNTAASLKIKTAPESDAALQARGIADNCTNLEELIEAIRKFDGCDIKKSANQCVIGDGDVKAKVMLIGEAPGANEDKEGIPFCGQSGKLLNNVIKSVGLDRETVYITNTVFWRPPGNRRPTPQEIAICRPFVEKHIALIQPQLIILVGSTAVESLLGTQSPISELRQKEFSYCNKYLPIPISTVVIYHPSYLLRQPYKKKEMWQDMQHIEHNFLGNR